MIYYDSQARSSNFIGLVKIEDMQMHAMQSWGRPAGHSAVGCGSNTAASMWHNCSSKCER